MKKLSLYIFLGLLWCNVGFAEEIEINCPMSKISSNISLPDVVKFKDKTIKLLVNTDEMKIYDNNEDLDLKIIHGIETNVNIKEGISTSAFKISDTNSINEDFDIELAIVEGIPNTLEGLLLDYKRKFFKYPGTENFMNIVLTKDYKGFEAGAKISFENVKNFTEREFFKMPFDDSHYKKKLKKIKKEYRSELNANKTLYTKDDEKTIKMIKNRYGKVYNYFSILKLSENSKYLYRGHIYWGGDKKKGFAIDILDMAPGNTSIYLNHPFYHYEQTRYPFSFQFKLKYGESCE